MIPLHFGGVEQREIALERLLLKPIAKEGQVRFFVEPGVIA
jgi:hypothetical protein